MQSLKALLSWRVFIASFQFKDKLGDSESCVKQLYWLICLSPRSDFTEDPQIHSSVRTRTATAPTSGREWAVSLGQTWEHSEGTFCDSLTIVYFCPAAFRRNSGPACLQPSHLLWILQATVYHSEPSEDNRPNCKAQPLLQSLVNFTVNIKLDRDDIIAIRDCRWREPTVLLGL